MRGGRPHTIQTKLCWGPLVHLVVYRAATRPSMRRTKEGEDTIEEALRSMEKQLSTRHLTDMLGGVASWLHGRGSKLRVGCLTFGNDAVLSVLESIASRWNGSFNATFWVEHTFSVIDDLEWQEYFLATSLTPQHVFKDLQGILADDWFTDDVMTDDYVTLPDVDIAFGCLSPVRSNFSVGANASAWLQFDWQRKPLAAVLFSKPLGSVNNYGSLWEKDNLPEFMQFVQSMAALSQVRQTQGQERPRAPA